MKVLLRYYLSNTLTLCVGNVMPAFEEVNMFISVGWWLIVSVLIIGMLASLIIFAMSGKEVSEMKRY